MGVTFKQAAWALMFVALYIAVLAAGILAAGLSGLVDFTPESVILLILCGATVAAMLALHIHLIRRNGLSLGGLGFRRFRPRMLHLLWQIPSAIWFCSPLYTSSPWASRWRSSDGSIRTYGLRCYSTP